MPFIQAVAVIKTVLCVGCCNWGYDMGSLLLSQSWGSNKLHIHWVGTLHGVSEAGQGHVNQTWDLLGASSRR